jgi:hypothetical protein
MAQIPVLPGRPAGGGLEKGALGEKSQSLGWQSFSEAYRRTFDGAGIRVEFETDNIANKTNC